MKQVSRIAGCIAALTICLAIASTGAHAAADTAKDSGSNRSSETSASSNAEQASSESSQPNSSTTPPSISSKDESRRESATSRKTRESDEASESLDSDGDDPTEPSDDAEDERPASRTTADTDPTEASVPVDSAPDTTTSAGGEADTPDADDPSTADPVAAPMPDAPDSVAATPETVAATPETVAVAPETDSPATVSTPDQHDRPSPAGATRTAAVVAEPAKPDFFTWIQRTFFNRTPTVSFDPDSLITRADGTIVGSVFGSDADGDVLIYTAGQPVNGGTVILNSDGTFVYSPGPGFAFDGTDLFTVTVSDDAPENGWHVHGLLGFLIPGWGSTATTNVSIGAATAAGRYGWGTPRETRFTDPRALAGWDVYDSPGHNGWGTRTPDAISFVDGVMVITGDADGNTAGLAWNIGQMYGAWEVRVKVPEGAGDYHAVALLWPDAENWPVGGEVDFMEIIGDPQRQLVSHFLHYSAQNLTEDGATEVDATQWHNYAVSWTPQAITIYIDGVPVFQSTNWWRFPPGPMHLTLQLDASEKRPPDLSGGAQMMVAWARQYTLSQIS